VKKKQIKSLTFFVSS